MKESTLGVTSRILSVSRMLQGQREKGGEKLDSEGHTVNISDDSALRRIWIGKRGAILVTGNTEARKGSNL